MKIVFLDIDGVLNSREYDRQRDWSKVTFIDETRLPLIKRIIDATGAKIILSSTWRDQWSRDASRLTDDGKYIVDAFAKHGIEIFDKTPSLGLQADRGDEIREWLLFNDGVESFVIIDDCRYDWREMSDKFVKTDAYIGRGLEERHVRRAIEILSGKANVGIIGSRVHVVIDRKIGSTHPNHANIKYEVNYGYVPDVIGGDGEEQDAYVLGVDEPIDAFDGVVTAIIHREDDNEDKWVVVPDGYTVDVDAIRKSTDFMEKFFKSKIIR